VRKASMPLFIDIHEIAGATVEEIADAHVKDVSVQDQYGVSYVRYWLNESRGKVFCLCSAPDAEAAQQVHREAHGLLAERIIEVDPDLVGPRGPGRLPGPRVRPARHRLRPRPSEHHRGHVGVTIP